MKLLRTLALATALMAVLASTLSAQASVGLSVFGGGFIPNGDVPLPGQTELDVSQDAGLIVGGRLNVQFLRIGIEAEAGYAFASVDPIVAEQRDFPDATTIFLGSVNLIFIIYQAPLSPLSIYVSAGGGLVNRRGRTAVVAYGKQGLGGEQKKLPVARHFDERMIGQARGTLNVARAKRLFRAPLII